MGDGVGRPRGGINLFDCSSIHLYHDFVLLSSFFTTCSLVDEHDRAITPKDYLDMALQPQLDGDSDQRKSKNKIRTTLKFR